MSVSPIMQQCIVVVLAAFAALVWESGIAAVALWFSPLSLSFSSPAPVSPCRRRFVWNFFRLENEHLNNCGEFRAVRDISVAPLNADDQTLLEQMMDQEDGVRNRQGKKSWKRSYSLSLRRPLLSSQYGPPPSPLNPASLQPSAG